MPASTRAFTEKLNKILNDEVIISAEDLVIPRRYTSGNLALDVILGGGFPGNQWTEVIGLESSGKTATMFKMIAANQKLDPEFTALWVAAEHFDSEQAGALGVDLTRVDVARTQNMEAAFEIMIQAADSRAFDCIILDSYPALVPSEETEKGMDEFVTAAGARLLAKFTRKAGPASLRKADGSERPFFGVIINQWRDQIGGFSRFGTPKITPGGKAKNYFFYCRIEISRIKYLEEKRPGVKDAIKVGQEIKYVTVKNKSAAPQQMTTTDFYFRPAPIAGFRRGDYDLAKDYTTVAVSLGVIEKRGGWYYFGADKWNGEEKVKDALRANPSLQDAVRKEVIELASDPHALSKRAEADG